jgi:membrane protein DedA with SNARE-associated domain
MPSDVVVVALTALSISAGVPNMWALGLVAALGSVAGDNLAYWVGRRIGVQRWRWMKGRRAQRAILSARTGLARRGVVLMLTSRYIPIGRVAVTMSAGATGFPRRRFIPLSVLAGLSWSAYLVTVGVLAGSWAQDNPLLSIGLAISIAIGLGVLVERASAALGVRRDGRGDTALRTGSLPW